MNTLPCNNAPVLRNYKGYRMGSSHHNSKLNEASVRNLRYRHEELKEGYLKLANDTGLSRSTIRDVCLYSTWRHVH